jgi:hypothetical protein
MPQPNLPERTVVHVTAHLGTDARVVVAPDVDHPGALVATIGSTDHGVQLYASPETVARLASDMAAQVDAIEASG